MKLNTLLKNSLVVFSVFCCVFAAAMLLVTATPAFAQTAHGSIVGTLTDASGGVVPHTPVSLVNSDTGSKYSSVTDGSGYFQFLSIPPANYKIAVTKTGFKQISRGPFKLEVEGSLRINLALEVGSESQTVTVTAASPLIQAETTTIGSVIDERQTTEIPLNGRNPMNLTALVPSVIPQGQATGNTNAANPFAWGDYQIGGGIAGQSSVYIDGSPINTTYINLTALVPTQDSLGEFKVDTNGLSPDYGHTAGGAVQFSTKSGTNHLHGAFWEYFRNKVLNSNDWWIKHNYGGTGAAPRGAFSQNQFGANLGGPVYIPNVYDGRNKTFFFLNWEGFYARQGAPVTNTIPTTAEINGHLSGLYTGYTLYDPTTTCTALPCDNVTYPDEVNVGDREPIANNDLVGGLPAGSTAGLNAAAQKYIQTFYPAAPKVGGVEITDQKNDYTSLSAQGGQNFETVAKLDHNFNDKHHISTRYTHWKNTNLPQDPLGTGICKDRCQEVMIVNNWVLNDTYAFNPTTIMDLRLSYLRFEYHRTAKLSSFLPSDIGQTGPWTSQIEFPGPMMISIGDFDTSNTFGSGGADSTINNASDNDRIAGSLTKILGKHTIKVGGEYLRATFNYAQTNNSAGQGSAGRDYTQINALSPPPNDTTGSGLGSFLLGYTDPINFHVATPLAAEQLYPAVYGNDDWRVSPKVTLHMGLRWEADLPFTERFNNMSYFSLTDTNPILAANAALLASQGLATVPAGSVEVVNSTTNPTRRAQNPDWKQISPRAGLTWAVRPTTVVSAGFGINWVPIDVGFGASPANDPVDALSTTQVSTTTPYYLPADTNNFTNPLPSGIIAPPGHSTDPVTGFQYVMLGQGGGYNLRENPFPYVMQWNVGVQQQFGNSFMINVAYAASKGTHLPYYGLTKQPTPDSLVTLDPTVIANLGTNVDNPFYGIVNPAYGLGSSSVSWLHMQQPLPQYNGIGQESADYGTSKYNSLQVKVTKRFTGGASIGAGYTYAKLISSTDSLISWLEPIGIAGAWGAVDPNRLNLEKSLSANDVKNRLVVTYVYDIPVGRGKTFGANMGRAADLVVGGWGLEGDTTFQSGYPLGIGVATNNNGIYGMGQRATIVPGCDRKARAAGKTAVTQWFNTACFTGTDRTYFGTEGRLDNVVRAPGINNWDSSIFKNFSVDKDGKMSVQFRAEFFNLFNKVQQGGPDTTQGDSGFGTIGGDVNQPRLVQFALRIKY